MFVNRIVISRDAEDGMLLRTAGHEAYHFIESNSAESAKALSEFVIDSLQKNGMDIETQKAKLREQYGKDGSVTDADIIAEITADSMFEVLNNKEAVNRFARKNNPKVVQRVVEAIDKLINSIRTSLAKMGQKLDGSGKYVHPEIKALVDDYEALEEIRKQFMKGMETASANAKADKNKKSAEKAADGEVKFSKKQIEMNNHKITVEMSDYDRSKILKGKTIGVPIYNGESNKIIQENNLSKQSKHGLIEAVLYRIAEAFDVDTSSYRIEDIEVDVTLSKNNLRENINKKANPVQLAKLLPILKSTVENAVGIEKHANRYFYDNTTTHFENLIGGYIDGEFFVPVRFGLKHIKGGNPVLYVIIDQNKISKKEMETEVLVHTTQQKEGSTYTHSISYFRLSQIIPFVNNKDLLRYLPDDIWRTTEEASMLTAA